MAYVPVMTSPDTRVSHSLTHSLSDSSRLHVHWTQSHFSRHSFVMEIQLFGHLKYNFFIIELRRFLKLCLLLTVTRV